MIHEATNKISELEADLCNAYARINELQLELAKYATDPLRGLGVEGSQAEEIKRLRIQLDQEQLQRKFERAKLYGEIELANRCNEARWKAFHTEFQEVFLKMGFDKQLKGFLKDGADFVKANLGTVQATVHAKQVLRRYLDLHAFLSEQALVRLRPNDRGVGWNFKIDYWAKRYDYIANMTPSQQESWKKFRVFVAWHNSINYRAMVENQSAGFAARACLAAIDSNSASSVLLPTLQSALYARRAATATEELLSDIRVACEKLWLDIEEGLAEVSCKREEARQVQEDQSEAANRAKCLHQETSSIWEHDESDDHQTPQRSHSNTNPYHVEDSFWSGDEYFEFSPQFNPANGLPMCGMVDMNGNMYGSNLNDFHF